MRADMNRQVDDSELYTLNITSRAKYNRTVVQCEASTRDQYITSENATLIIQGNWNEYMYGIISTV